MSNRKLVVLGLAVPVVVAVVAVFSVTMSGVGWRWDPAKAKVEWYIENWQGPYRLDVRDEDPLSKYFVHIHKGEDGIYAMHLDENDAFLYVDSSDPKCPGDLVVSVTWMEGKECVCTASAFDLAGRKQLWRTRVKARPEEESGTGGGGAWYAGDKTILEYDGSGRLLVFGRGHGRQWEGKRWLAVLDLKTGKIR